MVVAAAKSTMSHGTACWYRIETEPLKLPQAVQGNVSSTPFGLTNEMSRQNTSKPIRVSHIPKCSRMDQECTCIARRKLVQRQVIVIETKARLGKSQSKRSKWPTPPIAKMGRKAATRAVHVPSAAHSQKVVAVKYRRWIP